MRRLTGFCLTALLAFFGVCFPVTHGHSVSSLKVSVGAPSTTAAAAPQAAAEWTVMVFMDGDNNLEKFAIKDFAEMAKVSDSNQVNVVVQLDRIPGFDSSNGDWTQTLRFKMRQGLTPTLANALPGFNKEANMGHPDTLADFVRWAKSSYPAKHYMLVLWDHGDGWRKLHTVSIQNEVASVITARRAEVEAETSRSAAKGKPRSLSGFIPFDRTMDAPFRSVSMDETDRDRLYMRELQDSLEGVFASGGKLDIIGFDACLMAMVENGYAFRRVADVLVGSEELEPGDGWQYDDWLQQLVNNPFMDAPALGKVLVSSYQKTYTATALADPSTTLSAIDLSQGKMDALAGAISDFGNELTANLNSDLVNIRGARDNCSQYAPGEGYYGIDLYRFCEQVAARTGSPPLREKAQVIMRLLENSLTPPQMVLQAYAGSDRQGTFGSHGLAIYFPATRAVFLSDSFHSAYLEGNHEYAVQFVEEQRWDNFLQEYYKLVQ